VTPEMVVEPEVVATVEKIVLTTPPNQQRKQQQQQMVTLKRKTTNLKGYYSQSGKSVSVNA
jgi:histidinol dehydrogenase